MNKFWGPWLGIFLLPVLYSVQQPAERVETARPEVDDPIPSQTHEPVETILYFPDYVDGGGWSVQLVLSNVDPNDAVEARVEVYDPDRQPVRDLFDSELTLEIPALGSRILKSPGSGAIRRGWIQVRTESASVSGLLTYRQAQTGIEVGVKPVELGSQFALYVEESPTVGAGVAIFKPDASSSVALRVRDEDGNDPLEGAVVSWDEDEFHQAARTLPEWFTVEGIDTGFLRDFRGLLFLETEDVSSFAPLGLRFGKQTSSLSSVPAIRNPSQEPQESTLYFPDYVNGGGWSVQLVLSNVETADPATVVVEVYDPDGQPVEDLFDSELTLEIPPLGSRVLKSAGTGPIRRGWIQVRTEPAAVSGLLTYRHAQSGIEVSVEPVRLGTQFALFVEETETIGAGLAIFKPDRASGIELRIRDEGGNDPLEGLFLPWRDFNQAASTLPEWFDVAGVDAGFLRNFRGLLFLRSEDDSPFVPLGLRFGKQTDSLSAVPVIRIIDEDGIKPDVDLVVESASVNETNVESGSAFTFMATVRNRGNTASSATTLRYYRSRVARISPFVVELDTDPVTTLSASGTSDHSVSLTAPASPGTYYYRACVDTVSNESNTENNCSRWVEVTVETAAAPDLVVESPAVSDSAPAAGKSFTLSATVRNQGAGDATSSVYLHYYRSADATIETNDMAVGSRDYVGFLDASETSDESIVLTAPSNPGTYYYGACVDTVPDEFDTENNCSSAVRVIVSGQNFAVSRAPNGMTFANDRFYVTDWHLDKVFAYLASGQRDPDSDFDLDRSKIRPSGITFANNRFYVLDFFNTRVYAYLASGQRDRNSDFDLALRNPRPAGIIFANRRFYVVESGNKVYAYLASGQRDRDSDFDLDSDNDSPAAITFSSNRFYVVDSDNKVYAYLASGQRDRDSDFLLSSTADPRGIAFVNNIFYVLDRNSNSIYAVDTRKSADLVVESPSVSDSNPETGGSFRIEVSVRNRGTGVAAATTLRFYRSADRSISTTDTQVGTSAVNALPAAGTSSGTITLAAPDIAETYYYGACVDPVPGESDTQNNCSSSRRITVSPLVDLVVESPSVSDRNPLTGGSFRIHGTVRNRGTRAATATTLRFYRSADHSISTSDAQVGTSTVSALPAAGTSSGTITLAAPDTAGTYYYGACVDPVPREYDTQNNCSNSRHVTVRERLPDLVVESPSVSDRNPATGSSFRLEVTVRNRGALAAAATTLRYYRSNDRSISTDDTQVGTSAVRALPIAGTNSGTIALAAPTAEGTYYYGACVDPVSRESNTRNNCSSPVTVFGGGPFPPYDLAITRTELHAPFLVVLHESPIRMTVVLTNNGPNASRPAKLRFSGGGDRELDIPVLQPNETKTYSRQEVGVANLGKTTYRACIEAPGDTDTRNDCRSRSVTYER